MPWVIGCAAQDAGLRSYLARLIVEAQPTATDNTSTLCDDLSTRPCCAELSAEASTIVQASDGRTEAEHAHTGQGADAQQEHAEVEAFVRQAPARPLIEWIPR
jgi:hypothetical protein